MYGIDRQVIKHCLNVSSTKRPSEQKRRIFAPERNKAVMEQVDKLLIAGLIREIYYLEWLIKNYHGQKEKKENLMENGGCA